MTDGIFQLGGPDARTVEAGSSPFERFGHDENPFPDSGIRRDVFYYRHIPDAVRDINHWLARTQADTASRPMPFPPLAVQGALGVGKSHLLAVIERGLAGQPDTPVHRIALTEERTSRLLLANLLIAGARQIHPRVDDAVLGSLPGATTLPLIDALAGMIHRSRDLDGLETRTAGLDRLAPIFGALVRAARHGNTQALIERKGLVAAYILRKRLTPGQLDRINANSPLHGEGDTIRFLAQLLTLSRRLGLIRTWYFLLDQLEDLWIVVSPGRRARFLTDLRTLIDQCLEGAPIALLLAWNTESADRERSTGADDVDQRIREEYRALWRRMEQKVNLGPLGREDIWPFASAYLDAAERAAAVASGSAQPKRTAFRERLRDRTQAIEAALGRDESARLGRTAYSANRVLYHWRVEAEALARAD